MLTLDQLNDRRDLIDQSADLTALRDHLIARAQPVLARMPPVPDVKALLSRDGGSCPDDGAPLLFDPWSPDAHRCSRCGRTFSGERHHAHWARMQHLWIAERAAHLAALHAVSDLPGAGERARDLLAAYYDRYFALPNRDNVLGPSHLFFSTYLESIWIISYLSAAFLLRETDALTEDDISRIDAIANEAADLIASFNEGMSNRQTWNAAALTAIATWFGDEELAETAIQDRTGLLGHLADGFGSDGMWFEGDNYHLFALRGLLVGLAWARTAGAELLDDAGVAAHLAQALMAPADTTLPDLTFPARKDARYGVSLAHPAYIECWEAGHAALGGHQPATLVPWLHALYAVAPRVEQAYDSYLHESDTAPLVQRTRADLSWWALLTMAPDLPPAAPWAGRSRLLEQQGLAVIRNDGHYVSLECGNAGGGHGHPDRLHLTLFAQGIHWLPDPGTGSYVTRDLFWYRSTLAHNAPLLDGRDQPARDPARCVAYDTKPEWSWACGAWRAVQRRVVVGPRWMVDIVERDAAEPARLDLPWHLNGELAIDNPGSWVPAQLDGEDVSDVEEFVSDAPGTVTVTATSGDRRLRLFVLGDGSLLRATGPALPGTGQRRPFVIRRTVAAKSSMVTVVDFSGDVVDAWQDGAGIHVREQGATTVVQPGLTDVTIDASGRRIALAGQIAPPLGLASFLQEQPPRVLGQAIWIDHEPALDGSLAGFNRAAPLALDEEYQYFRTEIAYPGADEFAATAYLNWSADHYYLAVDVLKPELVLRADDAAPLALDNEPDDINADGIQVHYRGVNGEIFGWLIRPGPGSALRIRATDPAGTSSMPHGAWQRTARGYRVTVSLPCPHLDGVRRTEHMGFDVIVNEMHADRIRRAGQLIWSGGPGWAYLRGDRHDIAQFGELELLG